MTRTHTDASCDKTLPNCRHAKPETSGGDPVAPDINAFYDAFLELYIAANRTYERFAKHHGETPNALYLFDALLDHPEGVSPAHVCELFDLPKQTVSSLVARQQQRGLVRSAPSPTDGRSKLCVLTPEGEAYARPIVEEMRAAEARCLKHFTPAELAGALDLARRFAAYLDEEM